MVIRIRATSGKAVNGFNDKELNVVFRTFTVVDCFLHWLLFFGRRLHEDKKIIQEIAENIRRARERKGWTQGELAKKAGIDSNSFAKVERGESRPYGVTLVKIIKALGAKSSEILGV